MCAAVDAAEKPKDVDDTAGNTGDGAMVTIWSEAALLFDDSGQRHDFAPRPASRAMPGLRAQRKTRQYCDVAFQAPDGSETWAHGFVMAAKYSGCYELFVLAKEGMSPEQEWPLPIRVGVQDLDREMIELLVDFAYHIPLHERVGLHNVGKVLELAEKLKVIRLRDHCLSVLRRNLEPENCIEIYHLTSSRGHPDIAGEAFRYLIRNFREVWKNSTQFGDLTPEELRTILEDDRLCASSEVEDTFSAILEWISADVAERKAYLAKFLPLVRFPQCSVMEFEKVMTHPQVQGDGDSQKVLKVIYETLTQRHMTVGAVGGIDLSPKMWTPRVPKDILFVFGGWVQGAVNHMYTYNCRANKWRAMGNQYAAPRAYHGVAVIDQCIYFVGGFNGRECYHSVICFDVSLARWSSKSNMSSPRCYVSVAVLQGYIYAMGGFDGRTRFRTVERYDIKKNQWYPVADMNDNRSDAAAAVARGRIYIVGGFTGMAMLDTVECYDPSTNVWTRVLTMGSPRSGHKAVVHKDMIYVMGGTSGLVRLSSMVALDVTRARFTELPAMPVGKSNFAAVVLEGRIYTIGGFNGATTVSRVDRYDIENKKWYPAPELSTKCSAASACVVHDVGNVAPWL
ncbi:kelch-like protein 10 [Dermacentor albipictus]|uniref:kelch-like protein 10 n=1 Tax=Dermacentor albipictus TaxID=60249 RepID=UPI0038FD2C2D